MLVALLPPLVGLQPSRSRRVAAEASVLHREIGAPWGTAVFNIRMAAESDRNTRFRLDGGRAAEVQLISAVHGAPRRIGREELA